MVWRRFTSSSKVGQMSHRNITGVSPRFQVALELSDTLLCLGLEATRSKVSNSHRVSFDGGYIDVASPYSITARIGKLKQVKLRGPQEAKQYLIGQLI